MILVVGGIASGKRSFVHTLGYTDEQISTVLDDALPVLYGLEELLGTNMPDEATFEALCKKDVVVCLEVGMGVVPLDADERAWREIVGRSCAELAQRAARVVRMVCGIPVTLKETNPQASHSSDGPF